MERWQRRVVLVILMVIVGAVGSIFWPKSGGTPTALFRNTADAPVTVVHEKQDPSKQYPGQKDRVSVPPGGFAPFMYAPGDMFHAGYSSKPVHKDNEETVSLPSVVLGGTDYIEIRAAQNGSLSFIVGLDFPTE